MLTHCDLIINAQREAAKFYKWSREYRDKVEKNCLDIRLSESYADRAAKMSKIARVLAGIEE